MIDDGTLTMNGQGIMFLCDAGQTAAALDLGSEGLRINNMIYQWNQSLWNRKIPILFLKDRDVAARNSEHWAALREVRNILWILN